MNTKFFITSIILITSLLPLHASDTLYFPYDLSWKTDIPIASVAAVTGITGAILLNMQPEPDSSDILGLDIDDIIAMDQSAAYNYSKTADLWSTIVQRTTRYSHFLFYIPLLYRRQWYSIVTYTVMYYEAMAINGSLTSISKSISNRPRPYMYGSDLSLEKKLKRGRGGFRAFYSGHTSGAFCSAVFVSKVFSDVYPNSGLKYLVWGLSLSGATTTGILRYTAGKHFPSDVIVGACMGSIVGYLVPVLHKKRDKSPVSVYPIGGERNGLRIVLRFKKRKEILPPRHFNPLNFQVLQQDKGTEKN